MSILEFWQRELPKRANGDSTGYYKPYVIFPFFPEPISAARVKETGYQYALGEIIDLASLEPKPEISPRRNLIRELSKTMGVKRETAQDMFRDIEKDVDEFCREERIELLSSDEKAELTLGMMRAISGLARKISKRLE